MTDPHYSQIEADVERQLGRIVMAAGRLEGVADNIAEVLDVERGLGIAKLCAKLRMNSDAGEVPPWSRLESVDFANWTNTVPPTMDRRNQEFHAYRHRVMRDGAWRPQRVHIRSQTPVEETTSRLEGLREDLQALVRSGLAHLNNLLPMVRPGVVLHHKRGQQIITYLPGLPGYPEPATQAEINAVCAGWGLRWSPDGS